MTVAVALPLSALSSDEQSLVDTLRRDILMYARKNARKYLMYEGEFAADHIGIAVPPHLKDWPIKVGWGGTVVDVLSERLNWLGWESQIDDLMGLDEVSTDTFLSTKVDQIVQSSLVVGTGFALIGHGSKGLRIESKSPSNLAVKKDFRTDTIIAALSQIRDERGMVIAETLYLPDETVTMERVDRRMKVVHRDLHKRGRVPVVQMPNQPNDAHPNGRSLLTAPIEYAISAMARSLLRLEVHQEFYSAPQRAALGAEPEIFGVTAEMDAAEKAALGWSLTMGRMNIIPPGEDGQPTPTMHEFGGSAPTGYIDAQRHYSLMVCSDAGLPPAYLGVHADNPASADAIKAMESRIERRSLSRIRDHDRGMREIAYLSLLFRDGEVDEYSLARVTSKWASPATPTPSAAADAGMKLVSAGILPADSSVTYGRIGLTEDEQIQLAQDKRRAGLSAVVDRLAQREAPSPEVAKLVSSRVESE